jgi:hypothetical protein
LLMLFGYSYLSGSTGGVVPGITLVKTQ